MNQKLPKKVKIERNWLKVNTWGEAIFQRIKNQGKVGETGKKFSELYPFGSIENPIIKGAPK